MMASTRYKQPPLRIYQDPVTSYDHAPMPSGQRSSPKSSSPLRAIKNTSSRRNLIFNPPSSTNSKPSPVKPNSSSPLRQIYSNDFGMVAMPPPRHSSPLTDSIQKRPPLKARSAPQKALFTTFPSTRPADKENFHPQPIYPASIPSYYDGFNQANFSVDQYYGQKAPLKRTLMEAAPIQDSGVLKRSKTESDASAIPALEQLPILPDDGSKPGHSYAMLIGMAILRAPNRRLTLAQIYKWISDTYSYYQASEPGWQNSIRHNLSLNKAFVKQERPKDDPGKGNYWAIEAGMEHQFMKGKQVGKSNTTSDKSPASSTNLAPAVRSDFQPVFKTLVPAPPELPSSSASTFPTVGAPVPVETELSSDATIPASDALVLDDEHDEAPQPSSPPAPIMHSSPPVSRHLPPRDKTPPPVPRFPPSSCSHKRKFNSMDDSGYFSCLDSSAVRPQTGAKLFTSEADRPRIKRGRAEEEIARIRGSSYDSPSKNRPFINRPPSVPPSSSPLRRGSGLDYSQMLPPLTPAVKFKQPPKPPPSISPNTNLRMHRDRVRELVGSPVRGLQAFDDNLPWSPAFNLDNTPFMYDLNTDFDIFADTTNDFGSAFSGSPEKRSVKRPSTNRTRSANILHDIANNKSTTSTPLLKFTPKLNQSIYNESPTKGKGPTSAATPTKSRSPNLVASVFDLPSEDFYGHEFLDDEITDFGGMDILQGFQKIGAGAKKETAKGSARPNMGRSFTSRF